MENTIQNAEKFVDEQTNFSPQIGTGFMITRLLKLYADLVKDPQAESDEELLENFSIYMKTHWTKDIEPVHIQSFLICKNDYNWKEFLQGYNNAPQETTRKNESNFERRMREANEKRESIQKQ